jgi:prepilin-type N-terminal cleavage/methylation domain-containing protein
MRRTHSARDRGAGLFIRGDGRTRAFTLVEMLLASTLAAVLMAAVLTVAAALARDQRRMEAGQAADHAPAEFGLLRRDLANGAALISSGDSDTFELISHAGLDPRTLGATQRLTLIRYHIARPSGARPILVREQRFLDDPIRPQSSREIVATGVTRLAITAVSADAEPVELGDEVGERVRAADGRPEVPTATRVPSRLVVRIGFPDALVERELVLR